LAARGFHLKAIKDLQFLMDESAEDVLKHFGKKHRNKFKNFPGFLESFPDTEELRQILLCRCMGALAVVLLLSNFAMHKELTEDMKEAVPVLNRVVKETVLRRYGEPYPKLLKRMDKALRDLGLSCGVTGIEGRHGRNVSSGVRDSYMALAALGDLGAERDENLVEDAVVRLKQLGSKKFQEDEDYQGASQLYHWALRVAGPSTKVDAKMRSILHSNRAECLLKMKRWRSAKGAAELALQIDPTNEKAKTRVKRAADKDPGSIPDWVKE